MRANFVALATPLSPSAHALPPLDLVDGTCGVESQKPGCLMIRWLLRDSRQQAVAPTQAIKAVSVKVPDSLLPFEPSIQHPIPPVLPHAASVRHGAHSSIVSTS